MNNDKTYLNGISGNNLKARRQSLGIRQKDVAAALGFEVMDRISHWERGTGSPGMVNLFKLCALYKTTLQELYPALYEQVKDELEGRIAKLSRFKKRDYL